jgi:hypothetical protein
MALPGADPVSLAARVAEVDNARERVTRNGRIHGVRATDSGSYRISGYVRDLLFRCELHARLAEVIVKAAVINLPEPEIHFTAGTELTLMLTGPFFETASVAGPAGRALPDRESQTQGEEWRRLVASTPTRAYTAAAERPSDLTNVMIVGSRGEIAGAFAAAGWTAPRPLTFGRRVRWLRAIGLRRGFDSAPMSSLLLNGEPADMSWEKGLNDVSKRHHVRLWKLEAGWKGQDVRIGAATRDVDFGYLRAGRPFAHRIAPDVDRERDKVAYDLAFTGCTDRLDWAPRANVPMVTENATGDAMSTDTSLAVVELNHCRAARLSSETSDAEPVPEHGGNIELFGETICSATIGSGEATRPPVGSSGLCAHTRGRVPVCGPS